jgi:hypothetical protein
MLERERDSFRVSSSVGTPCEPTQKAGMIYINGRAFDLGEAVAD